MIHSRWSMPRLTIRGSQCLRSAISSPLASLQPVVQPRSRDSPSRRSHSLKNSGPGRIIHTTNNAYIGYYCARNRLLDLTLFPTENSPISMLSHSRWFNSTPRLCKKPFSAKKGNQTTKNKQFSKSKGKKKKKSKVQWMKDPIQQREKTEQKEVPRAFLAPTASSHAYIARCAVMDEVTGELYVDPKSLFTEVTSNNGATNTETPKKRPLQLPRIFRNSHFEYFHPSSFPNFEPPTNGTPEVAFLGRSNTGKSSLINALSALIQRGGGGGGGGGKSSASGGGELARTSKTPGRTQTINYFGLIPNDSESVPQHSMVNKTKQNQISANQSKLFLVDLPGFGFAAAPDESVDEWQQKTQDFLISRASIPEEGGEGTGKPFQKFGQCEVTPPLKRLYLLLDSRLPDPPLLDLSVMGWCDDYSIPYTIVLTKVDSTSRANCVKLTNQICMRYHSLFMDTHDEADEVYMDPVVYWTSAKGGLGMEELLLSVENNMFSSEEDHDVERIVEFEDEEATSAH